MKKHLIAAAVAAAVVAPAFAQSSVSVYGRLDGGYLDRETKYNSAKVNSSTQKTSAGTAFSSFTTSRLGFMGTEDLGNGLKAGFVVEGNIQPAAGTTGSNNATDMNFGRQQYLTLSGNFGTVLIGKTDAMVKSVFDNYDAGFSNNLTGAFDSFSDGTQTSGSGGSGIVGNRRDTTVRYTAPSFSGLNVSVGLMRDTTSSDTLGKGENASGFELGLRYATGALSVAAAYRDTESKTPSVAQVNPTCTTTSIVAGCTTGTAAVAATNDEVKTWGLGASYDLGMAVLFGQYFDQEDKNKVSSAKVDTNAYAIGIRVPMGTSTLFASYTDGEYKPSGTKTDQKGYQLGVKYDLSKRTYAYAAYGDKEEKAGANKLEARDVAIGIAHSF